MSDKRSLFERINPEPHWLKTYTIKGTIVFLAIVVLFALMIFPIARPA